MTLRSVMGGFIGGHLMADLVRTENRVAAVDSKPLDDWHYVKRKRATHSSKMPTRSTLRHRYGRDGFIETQKALCMHPYSSTPIFSWRLETAVLRGSSSRHQNAYFDL